MGNGKPLWSDEADGHGEIQSEREIFKLLKDNGFPYRRMREHTPETSTKAYPEAKEAEDLLMDHGEHLSKQGGGKEPLP